MAPSPATDERLAAVPRVLDVVRDARQPSRRVDPAVLTAFRQREEGAVRLVYREYGHLVYAVAHHVLGRHELAEEATQQTFVQAWQAAERLEIDRDPAPWLATIAKHVAIDIHRREARRPAQPSGDIVSIVDRSRALMTEVPDGDSLDAVWQVRRAIETLTDEEASVVRLQHLDGMTHVEIAEKLGVPVGTVKSRSHRAHQRLAGLLGNLRRGSRD
jgi:RNA polymerase sigma-70 factor (ECF subfamily)